MPPTSPLRLREALHEFAAGWREDLGSGWRRVLAQVELSTSDVSPDLTFSRTEPIFPARRSDPLPAARGDAHVFRAFDGLEPEEVRCVLLGQDPYPCLRRATGRSFEQGEASDWASLKTSASLSGLVQMLAEFRTGDAGYRGRGGLRRAVASPEAAIEPPRELFDRWQRRGVLCLNSALTLTRYRRGGAPEQLEGHVPFWRPLVSGVLRRLAEGVDRQVVLLLLGRVARDAADRAGVRLAAEASGTWARSVDEVRLHHPSFRSPGVNAFTEVNARLEAMGGCGIDW